MHISVAFHPSVLWFIFTGGQCPSVAHVSAVQSGLGYNVTVQAEKPNCSGWKDGISYIFTIVCITNCTSEYRDSANSSAPMGVFLGVSAGVFEMTVIAENSCGDQTVLAHNKISVGEPSDRLVYGDVKLTPPIYTTQQFLSLVNSCLTSYVFPSGFEEESKDSSANWDTACTIVIAIVGAIGKLLEVYNTYVLM